MSASSMLLALAVIAQSLPAVSTAPAALSSGMMPMATPENPVDDDPTPLATGKEGKRIPSKNESYNQERASEGRVGVRLGNDVSYRITGN